MDFVLNLLLKLGLLLLFIYYIQDGGSKSFKLCRR